MSVVHPVRNSTLALIKDVDFKLKVVVFLCGMTSLLVPLIISFSHYFVQQTSHIYSSNMPFTAVEIIIAMSCSQQLDKVKP